MKTLKLIYAWINWKIAWFISPQKPKVEIDSFLEYNEIKTQSK